MKQQMVDMQSIQDFNQKVVQKYRPWKVILFGSYSTGRAASDSDVDILVILPFEGKSARKSAEILNQTDPRFPIDLMVRTPEQIQERLDQGDFFLREILRTGTVLYESTDARMGQ